MSNIFKWLSAMAAVVLLSSLAPQAVHASANTGANEQGESENGYEQSWQQDQNEDFNSFLHKVFQNWGQKWQNNTENTPEQPEQPEQEEEIKEPTPTPERPQQSEEQSTEQGQTENSELKQFEQQVVELTNEEREKHGLQPLKIDVELSSVARDKSQDMQVNGYFDHNSPTHGSPFDMISDYGIDYNAAGENIAKGQRTPEEVVNAWMNSEGHRENILNGSFTHIGVGYIEKENVWTQQFIGK